MGAKASKPAAQAKNATRMFPSRPAGHVPPSVASRKTQAPPPSSAAEAQQQQQAGGRGGRPAQQASFTKDDAIKADGMDPQAFSDPNPNTNPAFSQRLRQMGVATPNPTLSNSSTVNSNSSINNNSSYPHVQDPSLSRTSPSPTTTISSNSSGARMPSRKSPHNIGGSAGSVGGGYASGGSGTTLSALQVRKTLAERAQHEFERGNKDKEFLDVGTLRQLLVLLQSSPSTPASDAEIEKRLNLKPGVVARLGKRKGVFAPLE